MPIAVKKISDSLLRKLGGKIPFSSIARKPHNAGSFNGRTSRFGRENLSSNLSPAAKSKPRKPIRKHKLRQAHWNPVPGALDKGSHFTKDKREKLFGVDKIARRMEIFERSGGRCEARHLGSFVNISGDGERVQAEYRCFRPIVFEDEQPNSMEWSHKKCIHIGVGNGHGRGFKCDALSCGEASCKQCHRDFHGGF